MGGGQNGKCKVCVWGRINKWSRRCTGCAFRLIVMGYLGAIISVKVVQNS